MYRSDLQHDNPELAEKLKELYALNRGAKMELSFRPNYLNLLQALDNPHLNLPPTIHVAGTNGKGSTIAILRAILEAAGYRVHVYTSPHLVRFNERIVLAGQQISDDMLESLIDEVMSLNNGADLSFFEITTAIAFAAFSRVPADIVLLETGLGGRLDCTNVIEEKLLSIITPIGLDHQEFLGDTLPEIAGEKAGIMKPNVPCVVAHQHSEDIAQVFKERGQSVNCPVYYIGDAWPFENQFRFSFKGKATGLFPRPNLNGIHQIQNAATALAALKVLDDILLKTITDDVIASGMAQVYWPARLQNITQACPLNAQQWDVFLDGGHNADAADSLCQQIHMWHHNAPKPLHIICTMMRHKDLHGFLDPLIPHASSITAIPLPDEPDSFSPEEMQAFLPDVTLQTAESFSAALKQITQSHDYGRILICGSLYLAGHVLQITGLQA
ncbi:MAG: bifunctional folylpolyglutamate synthase/ dihydrofolate synthase [Alphaproteobacteria bacterium]|nr:bifunctional folylpolyglutamate synthase/ dihydrofolate synthase [Alphaproteobacteria bacterium]|tara:strand:- start:19293 stop:20618 length:1326 start_codon:yes stop_codon:yes gene_type:complete